MKIREFLKGVDPVKCGAGVLSKMYNTELPAGSYPKVFDADNKPWCPIGHALYNKKEAYNYKLLEEKFNLHWRVTYNFITCWDHSKVDKLSDRQKVKLFESAIVAAEAVEREIEHENKGLSQDSRS